MEPAPDALYSSEVQQSGPRGHGREAEGFMALAAAPAVRALLRSEPAPATAEHVRALVEAQVRENDWLDYKQSVPNDVAKCVAAFANGAGGVLLIGIEEEKGTRRPLLLGCPDPGATRERVESAIASSVFPYVRHEFNLISIDPNGVRHPRTKLHDDATIAAAMLT
jgi:hypothetical protein